MYCISATCTLLWVQPFALYFERLVKTSFGEFIPLTFFHFVYYTALFCNMNSNEFALDYRDVKMCMAFCVTI